MSRAAKTSAATPAPAPVCASPAADPAGDVPQAAVRAAAVAAFAKARRGRPPGSGPSSGKRAMARRSPASPQAKATAAVILEGLTGMRSAPEAARSLGVTVVRYYALEAQAVAGLLQACEPVPAGPAPGLGTERELTRLREEHRRQGQELARLRAFVRTTQRSLGVVPVTNGSSASGSPSGSAGPAPKRRRHRRPVVRALTVVRKLLSAATATSAGAAASPPPAADPAPEPGPVSTTPVGLDTPPREPVGG